MSEPSGNPTSKAQKAEQRVVIDRDGTVYAGNDSPLSRRGCVDKYRPISSRAPWRGVKDGGREQRGFRTRKDAAEWVVKASYANR